MLQVLGFLVREAAHVRRTDLGVVVGRVVILVGRCRGGGSGLCAQRGTFVACR